MTGADARVDPGQLRDELHLESAMLARLHGGRTVEEAVALRERLPPAQAAFLTVADIDWNWKDGAMMALLYNQGDRLGDAVAAARFIGAGDLADILQALRDLVPADLLVADHATRARLVEDWLDDDADQRLDALDARYRAVCEASGEPLDRALHYARRHADQFFLTPEEIAADEDDLIARLVAVAGLRERATAEELAAAEAELEVPWPPLLARLYRDVGAGGWGGLLAPRDVPTQWRDVRRRFHGPEPDDAWPGTLLPVIDDGAGLLTVDASDPRLPVARLTAAGPRSWHRFGAGPLLPYERHSLRVWLEDWIARS